MIEEPQYVFLCKHCPHTIQLPAQTLGHIFQNPTSQSTNVHSVGVVCPECKHVAKYSLRKNSPDRRPDDRAEVSAPILETVSLTPLRCEEENCKFPLPLFAQWSETTTVASRTADTKLWRVDGLLCQEGHPIKHPQVWIDGFPQ